MPSTTAACAPLENPSTPTSPSDAPSLIARRALPSNEAFGLWFNEQDFGFQKRWALVLRQAAEMEPQVRAALRSQLRNGKPSIEAAVRTARSTLAHATPEEPVATVTPIADRRTLDEQIEHVRRLAALKRTTVQIAAELGVGTAHISRIAAANGIALGKKSRLAKAQRVEQMRVLARQGATSQQIAADLGVVPEVVRIYGRDYGINVPADATTHPHRSIDSTRIVSTTIDTVDGIGAMFDHIDYSTLPAEEIEGWVNVLKCSIRSLTSLKNRLKELTQP